MCRLIVIGARHASPFPPSPHSEPASGCESDTAPEQQTAVDKALTLLKSLAELDGEIGVSELARRTRMSKSTTFRLLGILQRNDLVDRVGSDYRLGAQLFDIGSRAYGPTPRCSRSGCCRTWQTCTS